MLRLAISKASERWTRPIKDWPAALLRAPGIRLILSLNETMKDRYLEVPFRKGKPLAAYPYLPRQPGAKSLRTEKRAHGIVVDYGEKCEVIGHEITAPGAVAADDINDVLSGLGLGKIDAEVLAPLAVAGFDTVFDTV